MPKKTLPQTVTIRRNEQEPEAMEVIAKAILDVDAAFKRVLSAGLKERAIVLLLHDMTKVGKPDIVRILSALPKIAETYLRK